MVYIQAFVFLTYILALKFWFAREKHSNKNMGQLAIDILGVAIVSSNLFFAHANEETSPVTFWIGLVIIIIAFAIFLFAFFTFIKKPPLVAFSNNLRTDLKTNGIYRFTRNPFYLSYVLTYAGCAIANENNWLLLWPITMYFVYWKAILSEEQIILNSEMRDQYIDYLSRTPRFFPLLNFSKIVPIQLKRKQEFSEFIKKYYAHSGTLVDEEYLQDNNVIAFFIRGEMKAGFIIGREKNLRTIKVFASKLKGEILLSEVLKGDNYSEVCCFWGRDVKKTSHFITLWLTMAKELKKTGKKYFLGGTYSKGLALQYSIPKNAHLINYEVFENRQHWIFVSVTKFSTRSALEVLIYRFGKKFFGIKKYLDSKVDQKFIDSVKYEK